MKYLIVTLITLGIALMPTVNTNHLDETEIVLEPAVALAEANTPVEPTKPAEQPEIKPEPVLTEQQQRDALIKDNPKSCTKDQLIIWPDGTCKDQAKPVAPVARSQPATPAPARPAATGSLVDWMRQAGIAESDFAAVQYIVAKESGGRYTATNPSSGAYGLCQSLPASKMATAGSDYRTNPVTQLRWCNSYAQARYSGWWPAYNFWLANSWW